MIIDKLCHLDQVEQKKIRTKSINERKTLNKLKNIKNVDLENEELKRLFYSMKILFPQLSTENKIKFIYSLSKFRNNVIKDSFMTYLSDIFMNANLEEINTESKVVLLKAILNAKIVNSKEVYLTSN